MNFMSVYANIYKWTSWISKFFSLYRLDYYQRAFLPLHKKFDININNRGVSVYVGDKN